jgi:hypothetical protein
MWAVILGIVYLILLVPLTAAAQYADTPRVLVAVDGFITAATQIGDRLFVAGSFGRVSPPTGSAIVVDTSGAQVTGAFPLFDGTVHEIVADGFGGWVVVGAFQKVNGQSRASFARVQPDRTVDPRYRITTDGAVRHVRIAHGRVYLVGDFTTINGTRRLGLAALDAATGTLSSWGSAFDPGVDEFTGTRRVLRNLSISSIAVYVSGGGLETRFPESAGAGRLWGFDAGSGNRLFERAAFVTALAATSTRVYVGSWGYQRPLWAVDPLTGADLPWSPGLTFLPQGSQDARVKALLVDAGRLYLGGYFRTTDDRFSVAAVDAATGQASSWRASEPPTPPTEVTGLTRLGPAVVATYFASSGRTVSAYEVTTGALLPWAPRTYGSILTVAPAPEGVVIGGNFNGIDGVVRNGCTSIDLETGELEPWTAALPDTVRLERLETDGTSLIGATSTAQFFKIDPVSGALVGSVDFGSGLFWLTERLAGDRIVLVAGHALLATIAIADGAVQSMPLTLDGMASNVVHEIEVLGNTVYLAGRFATVNGVSRPFLAAFDLTTGAILPFDASPDAEVESVRAAGGRLFVSGKFRRVGGARRRGLAELDPSTGQALAWNPDAPGGVTLDAGSGGTLFVAPSSIIGGRNRGRVAAYSPVTDSWLPWRPELGDDAYYLYEHTLSRRAVFLPDCFMPMGRVVACHPAALPSPTGEAVTQLQGPMLASFSWILPVPSAAWTSLRVDVGSREGASDLASFNLPADATSLSGAVPPGSYFARVRTVGPTSTSLPTPDVSFAAGLPSVPAPPLDPTVASEGTVLTFHWRPPSTHTLAGYVLEAGTGAGLSNVASLPLGAAATSFTIDAPPGRYWGRVRAVNPAGASAPSTEIIIDVDATPSPCYETPPLAPMNLAASVAGRTVTLTWQQPDTGPVANTQRVVAGTAPGLDNLGAIDVPGPATSFTTTAPPGTYYVRVLALNTCGGSFSDEVQVAVR